MTPQVPGVRQMEHLSDDQEHTLIATRWIGHPVVWGSLCLILLNTLFSLFPSVLTWFAGYWSSVNLLVRLALITISFLLLMPAVAQFIDQVLARVTLGRVSVIMGIAIVLLLFLIFRVHNYGVGDGFALLDHISTPSLPVIFDQLRFQSGDLLLHWMVFRLLNVVLQVGAEWSYVVWGAIGGLMGLWALIRFAKLTQSSKTGRLIVIVGGLTAAPVYFWFGHVESYTLSTVAGLWVCVFASEAVELGRPVRYAWIILILAAVFHVISMVLLPMVIWSSLSQEMRIRLVAGRRTLILPILGIAAAFIAAILFNLTGMSPFVPLINTELSNYSAFSLNHLIDMLNLLLRLAPLALVVGVFIVIGRRSERSSSRISTTLGVGALSALCFVFWLDPTIGAFRDWDLMSIVSFPLTLWAATVIVRSVTHEGINTAAWVPMCSVVLLFTGGLVLANQDATKSIVRLDSLVQQDPHYSVGYDRGGRRIAWAYYLSRRFELNDLAIGNLHKRTSYAPADPSAWRHLADVYRRSGDAVGAILSYEELQKRDSLKVSEWKEYGKFMLLNENNESANQAFARVLKADTNDLDGLYYGGLALAYLDQDSTAIDRLSRAIAIDPTLADAYFNRARLHWKSGNREAALRDLRDVIAIDSSDVEARNLLLKLQSGEM